MKEKSQKKKKKKVPYKGRRDNKAFLMNAEIITEQFTENILGST